MLSWCIILFGLGVLAFLDTIFNYGEIFRRVNSVMFMLVSLGVLIRVYHMSKLPLKKETKETATQPEDLVSENETRQIEEQQPVA